MTQTIAQARALAARRAQYSTDGQCRAIERKWAHTPVEGDGQMEMSAPKREVRVGEVIAALVMIAIGWGGVSWLRHGGMELIAGLLP